MNDAAAPPDPFADAALLLARARRHIAEFGDVIDRDPGSRLWNISERHEGDSWTYSLDLNRETLTSVKPIVADIANNLVHALDQIVAAACRLQSSDRNTKVQYPITVDDAEFEKKLRSLGKYLPPDWLDFFRTMCRQPAHFHRQLRALKTLSNDSKHWALAVGEAQAFAITWLTPGNGQQIAEIPRYHFRNSDSFVFWRGDRITTNAFQVGLKLELANAEEDRNYELSSLFELSAAFVERVITQARQVAA